MNMNYFNPTKIISGEGCFKNFDGFADFGKRCMIVTGRSSAKKCGALYDAEAQLEKYGVKYMIFDSIEPNPLIDTCQSAGLAANDFGAEFILGIGGGSALDASKAIAIYAANPEIEKLDIFNAEFDVSPLPILAVNTTVGTGSEVTPYSVLTVHEYQTKKSVGHPTLFPKIAFLDPNYIKSLPRNIVASTAVDALSHAIEGYYSIRATIMTDTYAEAAMLRLSQGLIALAEGRRDDDMHSELLYGSTLAGLVIAGTGTGFVHAMGYPLTYFHDVPHGEANAYFLAEFVRKMETADPVRTLRLLNHCSVSSIEQLDELIHKVLVLGLKLTEAQCVSYAAVAVQSKNVQNSLRVLTESELCQVYRDTMLDCQ